MYNELIKNIELNDHTFNCEIESIMKDLNLNYAILKEKKITGNLLKTFLDTILTTLFNINKEAHRIDGTLEFYNSENFIKCFTTNVTNEELIVAFEYINKLLKHAESYEYIDTLIRAFLPFIYTYKVEKSSVNISDFNTELISMLRYKNHIYGNAALNPLPIFVQIDSPTLIQIQLNNKIMRIMSSSIKTEELEDAMFDILGYLILYHIHTKKY